jgi:hypothetical protein
VTVQRSRGGGVGGEVQHDLLTSDARAGAPDLVCLG